MSGTQLQFVLNFPCLIARKQAEFIFTFEIPGGKRLGGLNGQNFLSHVSSNVLASLEHSSLPGTMRSLDIKFD